MKKTLFLLSAALILCFDSAFGWGKMGHDAIAYIAECHLTPKAKKTIEKYIGTSIVHYASWMDAYRFEPQYAHTSLWHTAWVDENDEYDPTRKPDGNAIKGIEDTMELLRDYKSLDDSTVVVSIKYLVHLVGDMHCPTHVKYPGIKGFNIYVDGRKLNYHGVWDSYVLDCSVRWSGMEFQHILDRCTKREIKAITAGSVRDWFHDCAVYCRQIYVLAQPDQQFKSPDVWEDFLNPALPIAERQILYAGYRRTCSTNCSDNTPSNTNTKTAILSGSPFSTNTVRPISSRRASVSRPGRRSSPNRLREPPRQPQVRPQAAVRPSFP